MDNQSFSNFNPGVATPQPVAPQPTADNFQPTDPLPEPPKKKQSGSLVNTIIMIFLGLVAVTFIGLFIWMLIKWRTAYDDVESQVDAAVATAVNEEGTRLEAEFAEKEKYPYKTFAGPADYGELSFEYPKTWSAYVAKDAASGGDYEAYLNPDVVPPVTSNALFSLRVTIKDSSFEKVTKTYESNIKNNKLTLTVRPVGGENANIYTGELPISAKPQGIAAVFKIRDKTAIVQTDAMIFQEDFYRILDSIKYNQ